MKVAAISATSAADSVQRRGHGGKICTSALVEGCSDRRRLYNARRVGSSVGTLPAS